MKINHAVLHVLDFTSGVTVFSQRELDLESRQVRGFVEKHLRKVRRDEAARRGSFAADSSFAAELRSYFFGERDFIGMSTQIADFLASELGRAEKPESADVLVADFEDDELAGEDTTDDGTGQRFFAVLLLASRQAFMHEVRSDDGRVGAEIARHYAILPNPSQKVASYAVVRARGMAVAYADKKRAINGEDVMLIPDGLLQCEAGVSAKEAIDTVTRIVEEVAEEFGTNSAVALSRAKNSLVEQAEDEARGIIAESRKRSEEERAAYISGAGDEIADMVVKSAEKLLVTGSTPENDSALYDTYLKTANEDISVAAASQEARAALARKFGTEQAGKAEGEDVAEVVGEAALAAIERGRTAESDGAVYDEFLRSVNGGAADEK